MNNETKSPDVITHTSYPVISLRDHFAGEVLRGRAGYHSLNTPKLQEECAAQCYAMADAMMRERSKV